MVKNIDLSKFGINENLLLSAQNKIQNSGLNSLTNEEKEQLELFNKLQTLDPNLMKFFSKKSKNKKNIIHITDTHVSSENLEMIIKSVLMENGLDKLDENTILVHTGDIIDDSFTTLEDLSYENIVKKANLNDKEKEEFKKIYVNFFNYLGLDPDNLKEIKSQKDLEQVFNLINMTSKADYPLNYLVFESDKKKYLEIKNKFYDYFKKAIINDSKIKYKEFKTIIEKYGANSENTIIVGGNHDVLISMDEILGEYMINDFKEVSGIKFYNPFHGSTGMFQFMTPEFSEFIGFKDVSSSIDALRYFKDKIKTYEEYKKGFEKLGLFYSDSELINSFESAIVNYENEGINSKIYNYFKEVIEPEIMTKIGNERYKDDLIEKADIILTHGSSSPKNKYRGMIESKFFENYLSKYNDKVILHGHLHENTTHNYEGLKYINPGSSMLGNYGSYLFNVKEKKLEDILFSKVKDGKKEFIYKNINEI
jgi:predicted phosphodiesterase